MNRIDRAINTRLEIDVLVNNLTRIDDAYFSEEEKEKMSDVIVPEGITDLGYKAFSSCTALRQIKLPSTLHDIECQAFSFCKSLRELIFPENMHGIGVGAFMHCRRLTTIVLPARLKYIGYGTFSGCHRLKTVEIPKETFDKISTWSTLGDQYLWGLIGAVGKDRVQNILKLT